MNTTDRKTWTLNAIQAANTAAGFHWFKPDAMRSFGTRCLPAVYQGPGGVYFLTQDDQYRRELPKQFTVRSFDPETGQTGTAENAGGERGRFADKADAISAARGLAAGPLGEKITTDRTPHRPITILQNLLADLRTHGNTATQERTGIELVRLAKRLHTFAEANCNGTWPYGRDYDGEDEPHAVRLAKDAFRKAAAAAGCSGIITGGDPRGCVAKVTFADGFTNDFGKEGYCVPTSLSDADDD